MVGAYRAQSSVSFLSIGMSILLFVRSITAFEVDSSRLYYHKTHLFIMNDGVEVKFTHCSSGIAYTKEFKLVSGLRYWLTMSQR